MDRLREEYGIDPARAGAAHDVGQHAEPQVLFLCNAFYQRAIDGLDAIACGLACMEIAARARQLPQLARDAVHVDCQADPAVANQRYPQFFLPHAALMTA